MRIGISTSLGACNASEWADRLSSLGCRSAVFPLNCESSEEEIEEYVNEAKKHDLLIAEVGIWRNALSLDEEERKANLEYSIKQLALADRIGARCCVNVAGACGPIWDGGYKANFSPEMWKKTVEMVRTVIDEVKPKNTFFTLEPMPWMVPTGPEEYLRLIEDVDRDKFAVHMDIINMINGYERFFWHEEFLEKTFNLLGKKIRSCHIKDVKLLNAYTFMLQECACGEGDFNLEKYVELIDRVDSEMPVLIEHIDSDEKYVEILQYTRKRLNLQ